MMGSMNNDADNASAVSSRYLFTGNIDTDRSVENHERCNKEHSSGGNTIPAQNYLKDNIGLVNSFQKFSNATA